MASLSEAGLSSNLGISEVPMRPHETPVAVLHYANHSIHERHKRMLSGCALGSTVTITTRTERVTLDEPIGTTLPFNHSARRSYDAPFTQTYYPYKITAHTDSLVIHADNATATVTSRDELETLICNGRREPLHLFVGDEAISAFVESSLGALELTKHRPVGEDKKGYYLTGNDMVASRLIQTAAMCGVPIAPHIPAAHTDRALQEMVSTALTSHYFWLSSDEHIGGLSGRWHVAWQAFAQAYDVTTDEVADLIMIMGDEARVRAQSEHSERDLPPMDTDIARRAAQYLVEGSA